MKAAFGVAVVGCGRVGLRRIAAAAANGRTRVLRVADADAGRAAAAAAASGAAVAAGWEQIVADPAVDVVVACTPNRWLTEIGVAGLGAGKHVFLEKPMGRNLDDARALFAAAQAARGAVLRIGFNHRFHPGLREAHARVAGGGLGSVISIRARYGHGSRPGCEREWRADPALAGGGELTDQGVHVADLIHWFAGLPEEAFCWLQTAVWPVAPLEDNAFGLFRWRDGTVAQLHVSMTQWRNLFSFEVFCEHGSVAVEGLGGSYGTETLTVARRRPGGGAPDLETRSFPAEDRSWQLEWDDFVAGLGELASGGDGSPEAGVAAMRMVDALYRSAADGRTVPL
jgi:predicted dehydrogenase